MLNSREIKILKSFMKSGILSEKEILEKNTISKRVFLYNFSNINNFLNNMKLKSITKKGEMFLLDLSQDFSQVDTAIKSMKKFNREERIEILKFTLFFKKKLNLKKVSDDLEISKTTLKKDFKILEKVLNSENIYISYRNNYGYYLEYVNPENIKWIKTKELKKFLSLGDEKNENFLEYIKKLFSESFKGIQNKEILSFLDEINQELSLNIKDDIYKSLYSYLLVLINEEERNEEKKSLLFIENTEEFKIISKSLNNNGIRNLDRLSVIKFIDFLMGITISRLNMKNWINDEILVRKLINEFFKYTDFKIKEDKILFECLIYHLKPTIYRIKKGIHMSNPLFEEMLLKKDPVLDITKTCISFIEKELDIIFPDDEIALLGYHFKASIERNKSNVRKKVILVCGLGQGTSKLLERNLKEKFEIEIQKVIPFYKLDETLKDFLGTDLILTTLEIKDKYMIPVVKINPLLREEDMQKIFTYGIQRKNNKILLSELVKVINDSSGREELIQNIKIKFKDRIIDDSEKNIKSGTDEHFNIIISNDDMTWEEAIKTVGRKMEKNGSVTSEYTDEMINIIKKLGAYIVIEEGIAIPHGSISSNVLKDDIVILISKRDVILPGNKRVNIFIAFAMKNPENRHSILKKVFNIATRENLREKLMEYKNIKEINCYLEEIQC